MLKVSRESEINNPGSNCNDGVQHSKVSVSLGSSLLNTSKDVPHTGRLWTDLIGSKYIHVFKFLYIDNSGSHHGHPIP